MSRLEEYIRVLGIKRYQKKRTYITDELTSIKERATDNENTEINKLLVLIKEDVADDDKREKIRIQRDKVLEIVQKYPCQKEVPIEQPVPILNQTKSSLYRYDVHQDLKIIKNLVKKGSEIDIKDFRNKHVLYVFIILFPSRLTEVIVKVGYSEKILQRYIEIMNQFGGNNIYLLSLMQITGQIAEKEFHTFMRINHSELIKKITINNHESKELYKLSNTLLNIISENINEVNFFANIDAKNLTKNDQIVIDKIRSQEQMFEEDMDRYLTSSVKLTDKEIDLEMKKLEMEENEKVRIHEREMIEMKIKYEQMKITNSL
jgi:hypothetical protein